MPSCVQCSQDIPEDQGSRTCSMCYGDPFHGKDGYYLDYLEQWYKEQENESKHNGSSEE